jgi:hypothetical protein
MNTASMETVLSFLYPPPRPALSRVVANSLESPNCCKILATSTLRGAPRYSSLPPIYVPRWTSRVWKHGFLFSIPLRLALSRVFARFLESPSRLQDTRNLYPSGCPRCHWYRLFIICLDVPREFGIKLFPPVTCEACSPLCVFLSPHR